MNHSETIAHLALALSKAQGEFKPIPKNRTATIKSDKGSYEYKYADLADVIEATQPILSKHEIAVWQDLGFDEEKRYGITTMVAHSSGEWKKTFYPININLKPQAVGSELTYGRRYSWCSSIGVQAEEDEDGKIANDHAENNKTRNHASGNQGPPATIDRPKVSGQKSVVTPKGQTTPGAVFHSPKIGAAPGLDSTTAVDAQKTKQQTPPELKQNASAQASESQPPTVLTPEEIEAIKKKKQIFTDAMKKGSWTSDQATKGMMLLYNVDAASALNHNQFQAFVGLMMAYSYAEVIDQERTRQMRAIESDPEPEPTFDTEGDFNSFKGGVVKS